MRKIFAAVRLLASLAVLATLGSTMTSKQAVAAKPFWSAATLPAPIQDIVRSYSDQCRQLGGTLEISIQTPAIMTADLDGDGVQDYVLNPQNLKCSSSATAFCGNGGCNIKVALSADAYMHPVTILGGQPTISYRQEGPIIEIWVDGVNCNLLDKSKACWARYSWKGGNSSVVYRERPILP